MRIHIPMLGFNLSGGVRLMIRLANGLVKFGHEVRITVPAFRAIPPFPLDPSVELMALGGKTLTRLGYYRRLIREAAGWGDVLVAASTTTPFLLRRSIRKSRRDVPLIYVAMGYDPIEQGDLFDGPRWRGMIRKQVALRSYPLADKRVYISRAIADLIALDQPPHILRCGVDLSIYHPLTERPARGGKLRIGLIGRFSKRKGLQVFFPAWETLTDLHDQAEVVVWPTFSWTPRELPTNATVYEVCGDEALARFYRSLDLFVFPSLFEGLGLPPLEAMACGTPVVLTDSVGVREYAMHEGNCLMVPPGDPSALASAIRRALEDRALRERLAENGLATVPRFTWENMVEDFDSALQANPFPAKGVSRGAI
ncbi:MAG: D-inositol-3-phosphate glycosyltransferase [bacterium]|nr:D-inositol-3-phosphate glycosyltransferase [bacterium]